MEEIFEIPSRNGIRIEILWRVIPSEKLHPNNGEDVDDDGQDKSQIGQSSKWRQDDGK